MLAVVAPFERWSGIMSFQSRTLFALLTCLFLLAACGQKGPLYLPGRTSSFESMTPEQQPEEQDEGQQQDSEEDDEEPDNDKQ